MAFLLDTLVTEKPLQTFLIIKVSNQLYPEIEPDFVAYQYKKLARKWHLFNHDGYADEMIFNNDYIVPLITMGWTAFKERNNLPDDVECVVGYYTPHLFKLISFRQINPAQELKPFHSRCINPTESVFFDIPITAENIAAKNLIIPLNFATFLKENLLYFIMLCGDNGLMENFSVVDIADMTGRNFVKHNFLKLVT
ncbi:hypothetical protein QL285_087064 [Trifolium repens]|nr:hypothetical protein QL285_087064 [Trifolium repens]